jgi:hypothetical protein
MTVSQSFEVHREPDGKRSMTAITLADHPNACAARDQPCACMVSVSAVCRREDLADLVAADTPLGPDQAAERLRVGRVGFDHMRTLGRIRPTHWREVRVRHLAGRGGRRPGLHHGVRRVSDDEVFYPSQCRLRAGAGRARWRAQAEAEGFGQGAIRVRCCCRLLGRSAGAVDHSVPAARDGPAVVRRPGRRRRRAAAVSDPGPRAGDMPASAMGAAAPTVCISPSATSRSPTSRSDEPALSIGRVRAFSAARAWRVRPFVLRRAAGGWGGRSLAVSVTRSRSARLPGAANDSPVRGPRQAP